MELFFRTKGDPFRPPLIILHGLWGASDNWLPVANLLSSDFYVILPDLRNHGQSPHSPILDYEVMSNDITSLVAQLNLSQQPFIAGHSMGGKILMYLLLKQPEIAKKAVVIDICPKNYITDLSGLHTRLLNYIETTSLKNFQKRTEIHTDIRAHFTREAEYQILFKNLRKGGKGYTWKINSDAIINHFDALMSWPIATSNAIYTSEILFIKAEYSNYLAKEITAEIKHYFPAARQILLPNTSHFIHVDQPQGLANLLSNFFLSS